MVVSLLTEGSMDMKGTTRSGAAPNHDRIEACIENWLQTTGKLILSVEHNDTQYVTQKHG